MHTEYGWLIEMPITARCGGRLQYVALSDGTWPRLATLPVCSGKRAQILEYVSPLEFTPDSNEALRFARKEDGEAFLRKFGHFILQGVVCEHGWDNSMMRAGDE